MKTLLLLDNADGLILIVLLGLFLFFGIPIILFIIGVKTKNKKRAKVLYIIAAVYLIISLGYCGGVINI